jgi:hypothetical protein
MQAHLSSHATYVSGACKLQAHWVLVGGAFRHSHDWVWLAGTAGGSRAGRAPTPRGCLRCCPALPGSLHYSPFMHLCEMHAAPAPLALPDCPAVMGCLVWFRQPGCRSWPLSTLGASVSMPGQNMCHAMVALCKGSTVSPIQLLCGPGLLLLHLIKQAWAACAGLQLSRRATQDVPSWMADRLKVENAQLRKAVGARAAAGRGKGLLAFLLPSTSGS